MAVAKKALKIRQLAPRELPSMWPLIKILNPLMSKATFAKRLKRMPPHGYHAVAVFDGARMVGVSGFWLRTRFWDGFEMDIDNFVIHPHYRRSGIGLMLTDWLEKKALKEGCDLMVLDSYVQGHLAHRFYFRAGFVATGFHFTKIPGSLAPYQIKSRL